MKRHLTERELIEYRFKLTSDKQAGASAEHLAGCDECLKRLRALNGKFAALDLLREDIHVSEQMISQAAAQARRPVRTKVVPLGKYRWAGAIAAVLVVGLIILIGSLNDKEPRHPEFAGGPKPERRTSHEALRSLPEGEEASDVLVVAREFGTKRDAATGMVPAEPQTHTRVPAAVPPMDQSSSAKYGYADATSQIAQEPAAQKPSVVRQRGPAMEKTELAAGTKLAKKLVSDQELQRSDADTKGLPEFGRRLADITEDHIAAADISEQPPFAPASAIELVTLPRRDKVQLTIYNSADLTLVRERRNLTLKKGWNWLQFMWANTLIDPTSLSLEPLEQAGEIDIQQLVFPARLRELGRWLIRSQISGQVPFEITYFTSGLSWRAFYMGTLSQDETKMRLAGYVRVGNNSGEDYEQAQTRLIVGKVHILDEIAELAKRQYPYDRPAIGMGYGQRAGEWSAQITNGAHVTLWYDSHVDDKFGVLRRKEIRKEGLSEYFLYTIEGTETIADKWGKRLLSFDVEDIEIESLYKYDEERWGNQAIRFVSFANDDDHNLGETPIPNGQVKIYGQADGEGYLSYVGGTNMKYIPVDEEVELNLGPARLVKVEPKLMNFETDKYVFDSKGNVSGWDEIRTWKIELTNTRTLPIEIEITRGFGTPYWTLVMVDVASRVEDAISYEKHDATHARFTLKRRPSSRWTFGYTVTTYHGRREEQANQ